MNKINYLPIAPINAMTMGYFEPYKKFRSHVMILAHLCEPNSPYTRYFQNTRDKREFILLDNGAAEKSQIDNEALIETVALMKPTVVIAPDELFNGEKTIEKTNIFLNKIKQINPTVQIMAVPHGNTKDEYIKTFNYFNNHPYIDWIGVSKFVSVKPYTDRISCMMDITNNILTFNKPIHILGCNNPIEIAFLRYFPTVKSIDSCIAWLYKDQEIPLDNSIQKRIDTPEDFFNWELNKTQCEQAWKNIKKIDNLCNFEW